VNRQELEHVINAAATEALNGGLVDQGRLERGIELMPERHRERTRTRLATLLVSLDRERNIRT
jgi:hypothetical protein